ncbi:MAG: ribonuclease J [Granulosicoccus sp.]
MSQRLTPDHTDFWFLPLGGCGEIGMNMNLYGHDNEWLMIDCGVTFRDVDGTSRSGYHVQMADPAFIAEQRDALVGILLTHAHEDHIGAVAHLWPKLRCPVYATPFTAEMLRRKLVEAGLESRVPIKLVQPGDRFDIGVFDIEWIPNTHSIPDPCGLAIRTRAGSVFHTADWKLDAAPQVGHHYSEATYRQLGDSGIDVMVCDSTCADKPGHSLSEGALYDGLLHHVQAASGRVIVACFGSNIARLHTLARVASATSRHLGLLGRSLINTASAARATSLWPEHNTLVESAHLAYLPRESLLLVATGSQGEARTALNRLSLGNFRDLELEPGDTVIFSARAIPGNERDIERLIERLQARDVHVITPDSSSLPIHASGHPGVEELNALYSWIRPSVLIPVHGEPVHLDAQIALAREFGIERQLSGRNGDLFMLAPGKGVRRGVVIAGRLGVSKKGLQTIS